MTPSRPQIPIIGKIRLVIAHKPNHPTSPAFQLYGYSTVTDSDFYSLIPHNNKIRYISIFKGQQILLLLFFVFFLDYGIHQNISGFHDYYDNSVLSQII